MKYIIPLCVLCMMYAPAAYGDTEVKKIDFSAFDSLYFFSGELPASWKVEYVPSIQSINVYNPAASTSPRNHSQIFIRKFSANTFLTLSSVDIHKRVNTKVQNHEAMRYEITKKKTAPSFKDQPSWRNEKHSLIDIRFTKANPSVFYVIAKNPALSHDTFERFISSLVFHNDPNSFVSPIDTPRERIFKKPFGIHITPKTSPVTPERFSGYHTGMDFEVFEQEEKEDVSVRAVCGGLVRRIQYAKGYGGVLIQECMLSDRPVTVLYGHLEFDSISVKKNQYLSPDYSIGLLGKGYSKQTDGERKHLHLGIKRGRTTDLSGYVSEKNKLKNWIDPCSLICR